MDGTRSDGRARWLDASALPRVISRAGALELGYSPDAIKHRLRRGRWRRVLPHTYLTSDTLTWADRLEAATVFAGDGALLSGAAALCDRGLRSVARPQSVLVLVDYVRGTRSTQWVRIRPSDRPVRRELRSGPPRASGARAVADLALERWRRLDDVRMLVAEAVRAGVCTVADLEVELDAGPQRGSAALRMAIEDVGSGAWSAPEARAARLLREAGLPPFMQNARIDLPGGGYLVVDFLWPQFRAVLEIDSDTHHALAGDADGTADRHLVLETLGYSVVHRRPALVSRQPRLFVDGIATWLAGRAALLA